MKTYGNMSDQQEQNNNVEIDPKDKNAEGAAVQTSTCTDLDRKFTVKPEKQALEKIALHSKSKEDETKSSLNDKVSTHCGKQTQKSKYMKRHPWTTDEFLEMVEQRDKLYLRFRNNSSNEALRKEFTLLRNRTAALRRKLKLAYQTYLEEL